MLPTVARTVEIFAVGSISARITETIRLLAHATAGADKQLRIQLLTSQLISVECGVVRGHHSLFCWSKARLLRTVLPLPALFTRARPLPTLAVAGTLHAVARITWTLLQLTTLSLPSSETLTGARWKAASHLVAVIEARPRSAVRQLPSIAWFHLVACTLPSHLITISVARAVPWTRAFIASAAGPTIRTDACAVVADTSLITTSTRAW